MTDKRTFGITTPLYYVNDYPHIGHAYCTIAVDAIARFHRALGEEVRFITGSDEHGQKIKRAAEARNKKPIEIADEVVEHTKEVWKLFEIKFDRFVRTTEPKHYKDVQRVFKTIFDNGDIYKDLYEGWYCTPCETFLTEDEIGETKVCPECGRTVEWEKEATYKFRLSKYTKPLIDLYEAEPWRIRPESRYNEIMSRLRKEGLHDLSVTRTTIDWGVPLDEIEKGHVCYVWFDALLGYATASGIFGDPDLPKGYFEKFWPNTTHIIGKDILWFHTVIWPAMQLALGWDKSKISAGTFATGFWIEKGEKMSKSKGNIVDPTPLVKDFGFDAIRYFLLREVTFGLDGNISLEAIIHRTNSDLANDLGNLLHRSLSMLQKYRNGVIPEPSAVKATIPQLTYAQFEEHFKACSKGQRGFDILRLPPDILVEFDEHNVPTAVLKFDVAPGTDEKYRQWIENIIQQAFRTYFTSVKHMLCFEIKEALISIWDLVKIANKYIDDIQPWVLAKEGKNDVLDSVFFYLFEAIRSCALLIAPFTPGISRNIYSQLGIDRDVEKELLENAIRWGSGLIKPGTQTRDPQPIVPRIDFEEYLKQHEESIKPKIASEKPSEKPAEAVVQEEKEQKPVVTYDDFVKLDLRVAKVLEAEKVLKADKLLKLKIDLGFETRTIVAGMAEHYTPETIVGKTIIVVANLEPRKIRGVESHGMLMAATSGRDVILLTVDKDAVPGSRIS